MDNEQPYKQQKAFKTESIVIIIMKFLKISAFHGLSWKTALLFHSICVFIINQNKNNNSIIIKKNLTINNKLLHLTIIAIVIKLIYDKAMTHEKLTSPIYVSKNQESCKKFVFTVE